MFVRVDGDKCLYKLIRTTPLLMMFILKVCLETVPAVGNPESVRGITILAYIFFVYNQATESFKKDFVEGMVSGDQVNIFKCQ